MNAALESFRETIRGAAADGRALRIRGGGSKDFYGGPLEGQILDTTPHAGVVAYEPTELVLTARAGTPLAELEALLADHGQMLAFEPPHFGGAATLGGALAAGLSGPRRAAAGAARDFVLGARIVDGRGDCLAFGGQVMKNVAGYDVSRLMVGAMGTLGLIVEASLKVLPRPAAEASLRFEMPQAAAIDTLNRWAGRPLPVSASCWHDGVLAIRLSGARAGVDAAVRELGGQRLDQADGFWSALRDHVHEFFSADTPLWRLSLPSTTPPLDVPGATLIEWNGALRWIRTAAAGAAVREAAIAAGGSATLFRAREKFDPVFQPLSGPLAKIHRRLKDAFDPAGILNPGRL